MNISTLNPEASSCLAHLDLQHMDSTCYLYATSFHPLPFRIFSKIVSAWLTNFPETESTVSKLVTATIGVYSTITTELLPTPAKSHYTFNLRDLSKVFQGMLMATASKLKVRDGGQGKEEGQRKEGEDRRGREGEGGGSKGRRGGGIEEGRVGREGKEEGVAGRKEQGSEEGRGGGSEEGRAGEGWREVRNKGRREEGGMEVKKEGREG